MESDIAIGKRVLVEFGASKIYTGIISAIHEKIDGNIKVKPIIDVLDEECILSGVLLDFWQWMANYYCCSIGEVMQAALPSSFLLKSESKVFLTRDPLDEKRTKNESLIIESLRHRQELSLKQIGDILGIKNPKPIINKMVMDDVLYLSENVEKKYRPKWENRVRIAESIATDDLDGVLEQLGKKAVKQAQLLLKMIELSNPLNGENQSFTKKELMEKASVSSAVITALAEKGIVEIYKAEVGRLTESKSVPISPKILSDEQRVALEQTKKHLFQSDRVLLHGVTGSGKTEIYIHLIKEALDEGRKCLYLLPEIALTTQLVERLKMHFGNCLAVVHSNVSSLEKYEIWKELLKGKSSKYKLVIGARSAIFMPLENLGLIVVDEEHDSSYKQFDPAPRYNARDAALQLARMMSAKVILGSATPSVESHWMSEIGNLARVNLTKRYANAKMPSIEIVDLKKDLKKSHHSKFLSFALQREMEEAIARKEQVILFQNIRGYSPYWQCGDCGHTPWCLNCDVSLTYHKSQHKLVCHYCGTKYDPPSQCSDCGSSDLKMMGFGTEKIEDELSMRYPDAVIKRMDYDTTRGKYAFQKLINQFERQEIDILVGTQMVTKGLDFANVSLVGILNADNLLNWPHFRSNERAFQLMAQVSGRAGRSDIHGKVLIQTRRPQTEVFRFVRENDYRAFAELELNERERFNYPPYYRLIKISLKDSNQTKVAQAARYFFALLRQDFGSRVLGPQSAMVAKVRRVYIQEMIVKTERNASQKFVRNTINSIIDDFKRIAQYKSIRVVIDVDPL